MQSVEEFMSQYLDERVAEEKREQASRAPFRQKFHTNDCRWDSRAGTLEMIQSERVLRVASSGTTAEAITIRHSPSLADSDHQLRYHLQGSHDGWLIRSVDVWCHSCRGEAGKEDCIFCHGTGWFNDGMPKTVVPKGDIPPSGKF